MPTIAQLNKRHAAARRQQRQWLLRVGVLSLGVICLLGVVVRQPNASIRNHSRAVSPAHLLRKQPQPRVLLEQERSALWVDRRLKKKTDTEETETKKTAGSKSTTKKTDSKTTKTESKTKKESSATKKKKSETEAPVEEEEETQDGNALDEFIDEEKELVDEEVDGGDTVEDPEEEEPEVTTTDKKTKTTKTDQPKKKPATEAPSSEDPDIDSAGGDGTEEMEEPTETTHSEDEDSEDADDGSEDTSEDTEDGSEDTSEDTSEEVTAKGGDEPSSKENPVTEKKSKKKKAKKDPKTPQEIFEAQAEEEEEEFWDAGDSGPIEPEEETDTPPRKFVFVLKNLIPDSEGSTTDRITIVTHPEWAPIGAQHFHDLVDDGFYKGCRFFRVLPDFIAQFGINGHPDIQAEAKQVVLEDDPVEQTNSYGTLTYATSGPNTRTTQLFFNLKKEGNAFLDNQGFAPFAEVVEGIEVLHRINSEYGEKPKQSRITSQGQDYLDTFPNLTYIRRIMEEKVEGAEESE